MKTQKRMTSKKLVLILAMIMGCSISMDAELFNGGGLFHRGTTLSEDYKRDDRIDRYPLMPYAHNLNGDHDADAPIGSGLILLIGMGGVYALSKQRNND